MNDESRGEEPRISSKPILRSLSWDQDLCVLTVCWEHDGMIVGEFTKPSLFGPPLQDLGS